MKRLNRNSIQERATRVYADAWQASANGASAEDIQCLADESASTRAIFHAVGNINERRGWCRNGGL